MSLINLKTLQVGGDKFKNFAGKSFINLETLRLGPL